MDDIRENINALSEQLLSTEAKKEQYEILGNIAKQVNLARAKIRGSHHLREDGKGCWHAMIQRCTNSTNPRFKDYGGAGISIYKPWITNFKLFMAHIGERPGPNYSIDRINNTGNYAPGNVRWANRISQGNNQKKSVRYKRKDGTQISAREASELSGIPLSCLKIRLGRMKMNVDDAMTWPLNKQRPKHLKETTQERCFLY